MVEDCGLVVVVVVVVVVVDTRIVVEEVNRLVVVVSPSLSSSLGLLLDEMVSKLLLLVSPLLVQVSSSPLELDSVTAPGLASKSGLVVSGSVSSAPGWGECRKDEEDCNRERLKDDSLLSPPPPLPLPSSSLSDID